MFPIITVGSKELAIGKAHSNNTLIHTNQSSAFIDRWVHSDWGISFGIWKSCKKMIIDFRQNTNIGICVNPSIPIGSIIPQIASLKSGTEIEFGCNIGDGIAPRKIIRLKLFGIGTPYFFQQGRAVAWCSRN